MWDLFSSPTSKLPLEDVLDLVYKQLERAHKEKDPKMALQQSQNAKSLLKDAEKSFAKKQPEDPALKDSIAKAYHEHAKLLDELGYHDKAQKSYSKAETWGYIRTKNHQSDIPKADKANTLIPSTPSSLSGTTKTVASTHIQTLQKDIEQPSHRNPTHDPTPNTMSAPSKDITRIPTTIFEQNITPPIAKFALPEAFERIVSSDQLAYCLSLLHSSEVSKEGLDEVEISWSQAVENDPDEKIRLQTMATDMVRAFIREKSKMSDVVSEIVSLSAVLDQDCFINLLSELINGINRSVLLKDHLLDGLAHLIRNAVQGYVNADNLVKILEVLSTLLKNTHKQSTQNAYRLAQTISRVLDSMIDSRVEGLSREQLHEPLSAYLNKLQQTGFENRATTYRQSSPRDIGDGERCKGSGSRWIR
ncbi:hypothetical protein BGZ46_010325 [Entomortierella lignicola]|nr:hypothetical protein BGZ46_010325 [Entomortierella lignicola]